MSEEKKDNTPQIFLNNEKFEVPEEGMLGLLALGDAGLRLWREKRTAAQQRMEDGSRKLEENSDSKI